MLGRVGLHFSVVVGELQPRHLPTSCVTTERLLSLPQPFTYEVGTNCEHWQECSKINWVVEERVIIAYFISYRSTDRASYQERRDRVYP